MYNGSDASAGQFPYQAAVRFLEDPDIVCGGSIISNQWILSSATCASFTTPNEMRILVGSIYLNSGGTTHTVLISLKHPNYNERSIENDVGLIQVNGQIGYNDFVQPIELISDAISVGIPLTISSWGYTNYTEWNPPNTLQYTTLKSISIDECKKRYPYPYPLFDTEVCTDAVNGKGLCEDFGSPSVYNGQQLAIVSIPACSRYSIPDVLTLVAPYRSWIKEITNV